MDWKKICHLTKISTTFVHGLSALHLNEEELQYQAQPIDKIGICW